MIEFALTDEQRMLVETLRAYLARTIQPDVARCDSEGVPIPNAFAKLAAAGVVGLPFPPAYGGAGLDYVTLGLLCEELEYCDTSLRTMMSVHIGLTGCGIYQWGDEDQKQRFLIPLASGHKLAAFGLTEPDAGSDVGALTSTARRDGDAYVLNGSKIWISCATQADTFLIFAKTDPAAGKKGISAFVVEREASGNALHTFSINGKYGVRAGDTGGLSFSDLRVPAGNRLGEEGEGFHIAMTCLENGRFTVAAGATGLTRACLDASVAYAKARTTFGVPIGRHQLVQEMIANMVAGYEASRLLYLRAGWMKNQGLRNTRETALAKWYACDASNRAADDALEIHGAYGFSDEYPVARFLRNSRGAVIYEGSREIQKLMHAEYALGYRKDKPVRCTLPAWSSQGEAPGPAKGGTAN
ncbi:MAG: butyryl-CoA dehydrogenase [Candidatus Eremiobacter antarcticus]|nr:acyl-CoA dehydrogenase family protein [Candidatus Eremiobacteraeota bacterium]MBC5808936.1 acyl-CoA dehydrogenase family protein [Candidatus Eremiobacteraeota bacterium]PZR60381.1 MAG: butyryl-CoA dehydrogenase [Candidatus Eremiobacter sp. RRmetagenome_bin22]